MYLKGFLSQKQLLLQVHVQTEELLVSLKHGQARMCRLKWLRALKPRLDLCSSAHVSPSSPLSSLTLTANSRCLFLVRHSTTPPPLLYFPSVPPETEPALPPVIAGDYAHTCTETNDLSRPAWVTRLGLEGDWQL